ncbi:MAG TPA: urease accessory protein UreD [Candidatus Limnocylindrales bacterium]|nr:urease accessory protein UreD [Candidatus Limnocylindrales bacterium]
MISQASHDLIQDLGGLPSAFTQYEAQQTRLAVGSAGKNAVAELTFTKFGDKTCLTDLYTVLPAKILRELYYDANLPGLPYVLFSNPTGGIVQGDRYAYKIRLKEGAEAVITDTTATKVYKMDLNYASKQVDVYLEKDSRLEFLPRETMLFADSRWHQKVAFHVTDGSKFLYSEIFCPGRIERGEFWEFEIYSSKLNVEKDGKLELNESSTFTRKDKEALDIIFGGNKFYLKAYWYSDKALQAKKKIDFGKVFGGTSEMPKNSGLAIKALSNDLIDLKQMQLRIWKVFRETETGMEVPDLRIY